MPEKIKISATFPVSAATIYRAWLNSKEHTAMTGKKATASVRKGKPYTAWQGYITGVNLELVPDTQIVQSWRSAEFPKKAADSQLTITLQSVEKGTKLTLVHENLPDGSGEAYKQGWKDFYFKSMKEYFKNLE